MGSMTNAERLAGLTALFEEQAAKLPDYERKQMFGCPGFFRGGTIFGLVWKEGRIGLKFPDDATFAEAISLPGAAPWKAGERTMGKWVLVPESFHDDGAALRLWAERAWAQALDKHSKPSRKRAAKSPRTPRG